MKNICIYAILTIGFWSCQQNEKNIVAKAAPSFKINPPIVGKETLPHEFKIDNSKDTILVSDRGSFVTVPKHCFVDKNGNEVTKNVTVSLTEYLNPADILLSGIPMVYMEGEDTMDFQSAGMCKILASANGKDLQLKQDKDIKIGLRNMAQDSDYNLYYFDTLKGNWAEKQKNLKPLPFDNLPILPVNLAEANQDKIVTISVENANLRPLYRMWHKSKFYIYGEQKITKPDTSIWWYDMSVLPSDNKDIFRLKFNGVDGNANQCSQELLVQPTIDSVNFESEMAFFYENMRLYIKELEAIESELIQSEAEGAKIDSMWKVQSKIDSMLMAEQFVRDSIELMRELTYHKVAETREEVMRSFSIKKMGIFNCDRFYKRKIVATKQVGFKVKGAKIFFDNAYLVNKYDNAVLTYVPFYNDRYKIDFDSQRYAFVGIFGGDIYLANIQLSDGNDRFFDVNIDQISVDYLNEVMGGR